MTRFGISFGDGIDGSNDAYQTPAVDTMRRRPARTTLSPTIVASNGMDNSKTASVRLSCSSPNRDQWHVLIRNQRGEHTIKSRRCVIESGEELMLSPQRNPRSPHFIPFLVETKLPKTVQEELNSNPPIGLICLDEEGTEMTRLRLRPDDSRIGLARLCVYSSSAVFFIHSAFDQNHIRQDSLGHFLEEEAQPVPGEVVSLDEPFETYFLEQCSATRIVRIRPAPQKCMGYAMHSPQNCLAMLTEDRSNQEYQLICLESNQSIKKPVFSFRTEHLCENEQQIVDFCFAQSKSLALFSSMSILLLQKNGHIRAASPVCFHGSVVPRADLEEAQEYLKTAIAKSDRTQAKFRQIRVAQQYLVDVFAHTETDRRTQFVTAQTRSRKQDHAALFPLQLQGTILFQNDKSKNDDFLTIEPFGSSDMVGLIVGGKGGRIDVGVTSPTTILPRFSMERPKDLRDLDDHIFKCSVWVERVSLGLDVEDNPMALLPDPNFDSVCHVCTSSLVATISSNCVKVASDKIRYGRAPQSNTTAWNCIELPLQSTSIQGVVTCTDNVQGHKLLIQLSDGKVHTMNVSEEKASHDVETLKANNTDMLPLLVAPKQKQSSQNSGALDSTPLYAEVVAGQVEKVNSGLHAMGKLGGTETRYTDITPEILAVVASIQTRCENEVVLPVRELAKMNKSRLVSLGKMADQQATEAKKLLDTVKKVEEGKARIQKMLENAESNALNLKNRLVRAEEASKALVPTVTQAELEFFCFVEQVATKLNKWHTKVQRVRESVREKCHENEGKTVDLDMDPSLVQDMKTIGEETGQKIVDTRQALKDTDLKLRNVLRKAGVEAPSENVPSSSNVYD